METIDFSYSPILYRYDRGHVIGPHSHPFPQLLFAADGVLSVEVPRGRWVVPSNQAVWLPPHCEHKVTMLTEVSITSMYVEKFAGLQNLGCEILEVTTLLRELLLRALSLPAKEALSTRHTIMLDLLQEELRGAQTCSPALPPPRDRRLAEVCRMIVENPTLDHSLEELASQVGTSSRTLARLFNCELGMSYRRWCEQARVAYALARLAQGQPAKVIAADLGYTPSAFSVMMRRAAPGAAEAARRSRAA